MREKKKVKNGCPKGDDRSLGSGDWSSLGMFVCVFGSLGGWKWERFRKFLGLEAKVDD